MWHVPCFAWLTSETDVSPPPPCVLPAGCSGLLSPNTSVTINVDHPDGFTMGVWSALTHVLAVWESTSNWRILTTLLGRVRASWPGLEILSTQHGPGWRSNTKNIFIDSPNQSQTTAPQRQQQPCEKFQIFLLLMIIFRKALYKTLIKDFSLDVTLSFSLLGGYNTIQSKGPITLIITEPRETKQCQEVRKVCIETRARVPVWARVWWIRRDGILLCNPRTI